MSPQPNARIGVIGGTGLYNIEGFSQTSSRALSRAKVQPEGMTDIQEVNLDTPFGKPSDDITVGRLGGVGIAFIPRHGRGHTLLPSEVPSRANMYALKMLGVESVIAINSCGSFKESIKPGDLLIPDQVIDRTRNRVSTFFGNGIVAHISFSQPFCPNLSDLIYNAARDAGATVHKGGTFIAMEGPAFSTKAESLMYQSWGADIVGMTVLPEAKLAREAELCYASIALVTDYDCWMERTEPVTVDVILSCMRNNVEMAKKIIKLAVGRIAAKRSCECATALSGAIVTAADKIPPETKEKLKLIIGKYV